MPPVDPITRCTCCYHHLSSNERRPGELWLAGLVASGGFWQGWPITQVASQQRRGRSTGEKTKEQRHSVSSSPRSQRLTELFSESDGGEEEEGQRRLRSSGIQSGVGEEGEGAPVRRLRSSGIQSHQAAVSTTHRAIFGEWWGRRGRRMEKTKGKLWPTHLRTLSLISIDVQNQNFILRTNLNVLFRYQFCYSSWFQKVITLGYQTIGNTCTWVYEFYTLYELQLSGPKDPYCSSSCKGIYPPPP